jgi:hypothetical protein
VVPIPSKRLTDPGASFKPQSEATWYRATMSRPIALVAQQRMINSLKTTATIVAPRTRPRADDSSDDNADDNPAPAAPCNTNGGWWSGPTLYCLAGLARDTLCVV